MKLAKITIITVVVLLTCNVGIQARTKLVALPERADTVIRLDNPSATLIEEERVLTLQEGSNKVDFSWQGVSIDENSIRLLILDHPDEVNLISVSYPPGESALVWDIYSGDSFAETVRISYLLSNIDRLVTYNAVANKEETYVDFKSYLVLRNFSGEDFDQAKVLLDYGESFEQGIDHEETKRMLFLSEDRVPIRKVWTFDARRLPWDPKELENRNVGIPVTYEITNDANSNLGEFAMWGGKARIFQDDGHDSTIFLGEDNTELVPVGEKMKLYIGDSRDIVVTQKKMRDVRQHIRENDNGDVILYDTDEIIEAEIENFKDSPAVLTMVQSIEGQWEMEECTLKYPDKNAEKAEYTKKDANTLEFEIELPAREEDTPASVKLNLHYHRINVRENVRGINIRGR
jgi:hypothetical protein